MLIPLDAIHAAQERLAPFLPRSPLVRSEHYSQQLGAAVWLKLELLMPTHAFKVRGALNAVLSLPEEARSRGVVTASAGNHGLGLAYAAQLTQSRATIVLPRTTPVVRAERIRSLGGEVIVYGNDWNAANTVALELASSHGYTYLSPFDHDAIMAGQGTIALEILAECPEVEVIVVSVGGGGLIGGVASAVAQTRPQVRVVGVETLGADCVSQSLAAGTLVELPAFTSIAESLGTKRTTLRHLQLIRETVERIVTVSDEHAVRALVELLNTEKLLVEPATSCALAALTEGLVPDLAGRTVVPVLCGGNITLEHVLGWLERFGLTPSGDPKLPAGTPG